MIRQNSQRPCVDCVSQEFRDNDDDGDHCAHYMVDRTFVVLAVNDLMREKWIEHLLMPRGHNVAALVRKNGTLHAGNDFAESGQRRSPADVDNLYTSVSFRLSDAPRTPALVFG